MKAFPATSNIFESIFVAEMQLQINLSKLEEKIDIIYVSSIALYKQGTARYPYPFH